MALTSVWGCLALTPALASAADPVGVQFKLEGCRLPAGETLPNASGDFVCNDADYTTGNLGKSWNELDLVPHRLTTDSGTAQTYTIAIAADNKNAGQTGYDVISVPVVNTRLSTGTCSVIAGPQTDLSAGQGGAETTIYRDLTITQGADSHCVFDYYERLALGSHLFPGSSLHSNLLNEDHTTSGIGSKEVSIPVKEILPQGLSKTMTATTGSTSVWNVTKDSSPTNLNFDTCAGGQSAQAQGVTITVNWTKTALTSGQVTIVTNITIKNPASRTITANVQDKIYTDAARSAQVGATYNSGATDVPANSTSTVTDIQTFASTASHYYDTATATYTDLVTKVPVPGTTTATADAAVNTINTPNDTATVTDTEQITGAGLSFSIDSISLAGGTLDPTYTVGSGAKITGPITWSRSVNDSGTAVFHKTVYVDGQRNTSGTLSDTASITDAVGTMPKPSASASTTITARACIQGTKFADTNANGARDAGEPGLAGVTVYVDLNNNGALNAGEPSAVTGADGKYSISTATIPDGTYTLREVLPAGSVCSFPATCSYSIVVGPGGPVTGRDFGNYKPASVSGLKYSDDNNNGTRDSGEAGLGGVTFYVDLDGNNALDPGEPSAVSAADGTFTITGIKPGSYSVREVGLDGYECTQPSPCVYSVTLSSGEANTGKVFGNHKIPPPPAPPVVPPAPPVVPPAIAPLVVPPAPPAQQVKDVSVVSGAAALRGPRRCVTGPFVASVTGRAITKVQFYLDNKLVATRATRDAAGRFTYRVDARKVTRAAHRMTARVQFTAASQTAPKKLSFMVVRCAAAKVKPPFTG